MAAVPRICIAVWGLVVGLAVSAATAEPVSKLLKPAVTVADPTAANGQLVRFDLDKAKPGAPLVIPLPGQPAGKYVATLRLKPHPADSYADSVTLSIGNSRRSFMGTAGVDPSAPDYRLWTVPFIYDGKSALALGIAPNHPGGMGPPPTHELLLDRLDLQRVGTANYIDSIHLSKVCYDPAEIITCTVTLHGVRAGLEIRATELLNLGDSRPVASVKTTGPAAVTLSWNAGKELYGREARIELLQDGKVVDSASDFFNVSDNVWKVALQASVPGVHMTDPRSVHCAAKTDEQLAEAVNVGARATYGNFREAFAWAPDDAMDMTPTSEHWVSGQACYQHQRSRVILLNKLCRDNGIWSITYAKSAGSGPPEFEFHRKHPEFNLSQFQSQFDQEYVEKWDRQVPGKDKTILYTWMSCVLDITQPKLVDRAINEILDSSEMFGWRGARYDDHYSLWGQPAAELSTKNMERIFELGQKRNPSFVWGFNYLGTWLPFGWPAGKAPGPAWKQGNGGIPDLPNPRVGPMPQAYPEFAVACKHDGFLMNEEARGANQNPGTYSNYAQLLTYESRLTRSLGGHYGPIPFDTSAKSPFDAIFPDILRAASRSHTYGPVRGDTEMVQFLTRYSAFIYGTGLEPIVDPEPVLSVSAEQPLWWHNYCYTYTDGPAKKIVVHLLGAPRNDRISANRDGQISRIHASVHYLGPEKVAKAYELSPFIPSFQREVPVTAQSAKPTDFYLWTVLVLELGDRP